MSSNARRRPLLVVVSAPSGAGKTTLRDRLLAARPDVAYSVSCTTRPPRPGEVDGRDYHFLAPAEFARRVAAGLFLEHAEVHGFQYGTLRETVADALRRGRHVLMDLDVQGAASVRALVRAAPPGDLLRTSHVDIFVAPPSLAVLRQRLEKRGQDAPDVIARRLKNAEVELRRAGEFGHVIVNDDLETAYRQLVAVLDREASP
jgi:guanylate kinase